MKFKTGDTIAFLNESGTGTFLHAISATRSFVLNPAGFEMEIENKYLLEAKKPEDYKLHAAEEEKFIRSKLRSEKEFLLKQKKAQKQQQERIMEVDLHIYELRENTKNLSNGEMLRIQLQHFKQKMTEARDKKMAKLIIIHGVGEGVLKSEIRHLLRNYENIEFNDADYTRFGYGATEVRFK